MSPYTVTARKHKDLTPDEVRFTCQDTTGETDVHFGLIPLDPTRNNKQIESRYVAAYVTEAPDLLDEVRGIPPSTEERAVMAFTNGDNFVEWGEPMSYDGTERDAATGRFYGAPGLHVVVRFGPHEPLEAEYYPKPWPAHNPTGLWKSVEVVSGNLQTKLFVQGIAVVEEVFADLLADGWRLCDYATMSDATDWAESPAWMVGPGHLMGMYA